MGRGRGARDPTRVLLDSITKMTDAAIFMALINVVSIEAPRCAIAGNLKLEIANGYPEITPKTCIILHWPMH